MFDDETPVAWQAVPRRARVVAADGAEIGTADMLLGDQAADIFHGVVVSREHDGEKVEIPAARVKRMTESHVVTDLAADEVQGLPAYRGR